MLNFFLSEEVFFHFFRIKGGSAGKITGMFRPGKAVWEPRRNRTNRKIRLHVCRRKSSGEKACKNK